MPRLGGCTPLVVTTHEGRPTHLPGQRPASRRATDRSTGLRRLRSSIFTIRTVRKTFSSDERRHDTRSSFCSSSTSKRARSAKDGAKDWRCCSMRSRRRRASRLVAKVLAKFPQARVYRYEAINLDKVAAANRGALRQGSRPGAAFQRLRKNPRARLRLPGTGPAEGRQRSRDS